MGRSIFSLFLATALVGGCAQTAAQTDTPTSTAENPTGKIRTEAPESPSSSEAGPVDAKTGDELDLVEHESAAYDAPQPKMAKRRPGEDDVSRDEFKSGPTRRGKPMAKQAALKAGRHDDNAQYNRFLQFLDQHRSLTPYPVDVSERLVVRTLDSEGKSLSNCIVEVRNLEGSVRAKARTYADGSTQFFPAHAANADESEFTVHAQCGKKAREGQLNRHGKREVQVRFKKPRSIPRRVPVDVAIVLDTTGSMSAQINRLKDTLRAIHVQLTALPTRPDMRFALVAYRDRGDAYVTQVTHFSDDVDFFQGKLDALDAQGGGDSPEDLQSGLKDAMRKLSWRDDAVRVGFIVADAVPHTDYGQEYTYRTAMEESLEQGVKWVSVGAGGLPTEGEVIFRQIAQYTMGEYVFVTGSGGGDTSGGRDEASHHVGTNYKMENLDQAMVRIVRRELSYLTDRPRDFDSTIVATAQKPLTRDVALAPAVQEALRQLVDYSSIRLDAGTPLAVAPFTVNTKSERSVAEYVTDQMVLFASREGAFQLVDRDLESVAQEISLQVTELFDPETSIAVGQMVGARVLIVGKLVVRKGGADLFARLVRVETGEILSVAKVKLDRNVLSST